jgi:hypothetical protein
MTTISRKQEILRSVDTLDAAQSEKVLNFIRGLVRGEKNDLYYQYLRSKAMQEIGQALRGARYHSF